MDIDEAIELLNGDAVVAALSFTTAEQDDVIREGRRVLDRQVIRTGRLQTGVLDDQDRARVMAAAAVLALARGGETWLP